MEKSNSRAGALSSSLGFNGKKWIRIYTQISLLLAFFIVISSNAMAAQDKVRIAVLPFKVHSLRPLGHLKAGFQRMLSVRMEGRGFKVADIGIINKHPTAFMAVFEKEDLIKTGKDLKVDWIISGSITQIGKKLSLDLKAVQTSEEREPFFIFMVAQDLDSLDETAEKIAVSIDHQIAGVVQIDSIQVIGNQRIEKEAILAVIDSEKGNKLDPDKLNKDLRNVYKMDFFKDVQIETDDGPRGKTVTFTVVEKPSIGKIVFEGNEEIDDDDLREEFGIKLYSILDRNEIKQSINRLKEFYRQKGYYNAEITSKTEDLPSNEVLLTYEIVEHEKVYITKIGFLGNNEYDEDELKDIMETSEKGFFSWITDSGYLDKKKLEFDVHKIGAFYHNHGFINAKVGEPSIVYEEDKGLVITIEIEEGNQYGVKEVSLEGDLIKPADELLEKVRIGEEKVFNREIVRKDIIALRHTYADEGYAYAEVTPTTKRDDKEYLVSIVYRVSKGEKVRFERIDISGNTSTRDKVIRRELKAIEGDFFSRKTLARSTQNLHRLGFFEDVKIQNKKGSQDDLMVLDVNVKERPTGSFNIGAGYSSTDKAIATFQISQNNLLGHGQKIMASARLGGRSSQYDIVFTEPWLFDKPLSTTFNVYKWEREFDEYTKDSLGGTVGVGFPLGLDDFTRGSVKYGYDNADITDIDDSASAVIKDVEGKNITSSMTFSIKRDSRDRPWNTHKGSINSISFEYAGGPLGGDSYFNKYQARTAWYFPLFWDTVFVTQGRWGLVEEREGGKLPVYEKFRLGGINTVRGFDYASISPVDPATGDRIGGEKMMIYNVEFRFPLVKEQGIVGLVFYDAGNVFEEDDSWTFTGIRRSAGGGIRWYSPIGPLRLEYGRNLNKREGEESGNWEFTVGGLF